MLKIAISGKANSGKNTLASMITKCLELPENKYKIVALADPIKQIIKIMAPYADDNCLYGPSKLRSNIISNKLLDDDGNQLTYRAATIKIGKMGRLWNDNLWLDALVADAEKSKHLDAYIVSDCRFIIEMNYFKNNDFKMIRILRNGGDIIDDISETEQDQVPNSFFDNVIENYGTLDDLYKIVQSIFKTTDI